MFSDHLFRNIETRWSEQSNIGHTSEAVKHIVKNVDPVFTWKILSPKEQSHQKE